MNDEQIKAHDGYVTLKGNVVGTYRGYTLLEYSLPADRLCWAVGASGAVVTDSIRPEMWEVIEVIDRILSAF